MSIVEIILILAWLGCIVAIFTVPPREPDEDARCIHDVHPDDCPDCRH